MTRDDDGVEICIVAGPLENDCLACLLHETTD